LANVLSDQDKQEDAAAEYRIVLTHNPQDALAQVNLGNALEKVGEREGGSAHLEEAVELFQEALSELKREQVPLQWAAAQSNLGNALAALGQRESGAARLEEAVAAYRMALDELNA
jgi:tetratricopeptide (TPR) repeat protein